MFGNESLPSKIYRYGAKAPVEEAERVEEQFRLAHRYRNRLVEIELKRRAAADAVVARHAPELAGIEAELARLDAEILEAAAGIKRCNQAARKQAGSAEARDALRSLRAVRKSKYAERKAARDRGFRSEAARADLAEVDAIALAEQKAARAESALYWGTYCIIEQAARSFRQGAPPKFHRYTGEGMLAVQLQGGLSPAKAMAGEDKRLVIEPVPAGAFATRARKHRRTQCLIRVGSTEAREPIFARVPFTLHRPLPEDAAIKWVYLQRRRVGTKFDWSLCVVLSQAAWPAPPQAGDGEVGINFGWRKLDHGVRVGYYAGSDGAHGELLLPIRDVGRWQKAEDLRSIRDGRLDSARNALAEWLAGREVPDWLTERTATLRQWRSATRLAALCLHWRGERFAGDEEAFAALEAWRAKDKHLYEWEANQRRKALAWREDRFRCWAADLARRYRVLHLDGSDLRRLMARPEAGESDDSASSRYYARIASPGRLRQCLVERFAETIAESTVDVTQRCHACGERASFDARTHLWTKCRHCGAEWDQDFNAACNLLAGASGPAAQKTR